MEGHARHEAVGAVVHPAEQQAHEHGVGHLGRVAVDDGEDDGRDGYGHPVVAHAAEQRAQYGTAEHYLFGHWGEQAYGQVAPAVAHEHGELVEQVVGQLGHLLLEPCGRNYGADGGHHAPRQCRPGAGAHVAAGYLAPPREQEDGYGDGTEQGHRHNEHHSGYVGGAGDHAPHFAHAYADAALYGYENY